MLLRRVALFLLLTFCGGLLVQQTHSRRLRAETQLQAEIHSARSQVQSLPKPDEVSEAKLAAGDTFVEALERLGLDSQSSNDMVQAAKPVFDFRRMHQGNTLELTRSPEGELRSVRYHIDDETDLWIRSQNGEYQAEITQVPSTTEVVGLRGELRGSLFDSVLEMGESPELAVRLADIFAWDIDFYTDPRPGDTFRLVLEKKHYANGDVSYGRILRAEYNNAGRPYGAVLFHDPAGRPAYYSPDGQSLQKAFLRSPLRFAARISSHFSLARFHPILGVRRTHLGTDYAAPTGTPVQAVADGRVIWSGRKGGNGILVILGHTRGYQSYYLHLSRALVRRGQMVHQGQTVGRVGSTGLATGPHLDFRLSRAGRFINWERMDLPPAMPVNKRDWTDFVAERERWTGLLPADHPATALASADVDSTAPEAVGAAAGSH